MFYSVVLQCSNSCITHKVDNFAVHFTVDRASDSYDGPDLKLFILVVGTGVLSPVAWYSTDDLLLLQISSSVVWQARDLHLTRDTL